MESPHLQEWPGHKKEAANFKSIISKSISDTVIAKFKNRLPVLRDAIATPHISLDGPQTNRIGADLGPLTDSISVLLRANLDNLAPYKEK